MSNLANSSFFVNLPSNVGQHTFPDNKASSFITKIDPPRQLKGKWSVALVSMSHPAIINNVVGAYFDVRIIDFRRPLQYYAEQWRRVNILDGYYIDVIELYAAMMNGIKSQHSNHSLGPPFTFDVNDNKLIVGSAWAVTFSPNLLDILGLDHRVDRHPLRRAYNIPETVPLFAHSRYNANAIKNPNFINPDTLHVNASIIKNQQVFGDKLLPLLRLVMYTDKSGEKSDSIYHEFRRLDYNPVSAMMLDVIKIDVTNSQGDTIKFQSGKVVLTLHFKKES